MLAIQQPSVCVVSVDAFVKMESAGALPLFVFMVVFLVLAVLCEPRGIITTGTVLLLLLIISSIHGRQTTCWTDSHYRGFIKLCFVLTRSDVYCLVSRHGRTLNTAAVRYCSFGSHGQVWPHHSVVP